MKNDRNFNLVTVGLIPIKFEHSEFEECESDLMFLYMSAFFLKNRQIQNGKWQN